ncbi:succinate dehydrogenase subunit 7B, mitochondrial-like isoform X2 [Vigna umbellata]|uniref:succinate dehydrogenase subunit 7B, mitochondrial-like isoform X2 n=1 Tax=Vigna umbellata TaxID=87088 RepID=UPI001F5E542E|nr:succinate dehydrogenase subunit 7B, mitochondrial-like isoform X2 [Vigna umbellata]XP_047146902.1 succinate dehydrogenase subunit 7B, mitochondrial-like isoform X2 [Vigna umbellata]
MAFLLNKTAVASHFVTQSQTEESASFPRRRFHVEPGPREKALLAEDSILKPFKSYKKSVKQLKRIGDVLTVVVVAGCCYEIYVRAVTREDAQKQ